MIDLKIAADNLWDKADYKNLQDFIEKLIDAKKSIMKSALLIEEEHYRKLIQLIEKFENFKFGKKKLLELRKSRNASNNEEIKYTILDNQQVKYDYGNLLELLKNDFTVQLKKGFL